MNAEAVETIIEILGKTYHIKCARAEISALQNAAKHLENRWHAARESGGTRDSDRMMMILALNLMHELLAVTQKYDHYVQATNQKINEIKNRVDNAFNPFADQEVVI